MYIVSSWTAPHSLADPGFWVRGCLTFFDVKLLLIYRISIQLFKYGDKKINEKTIVPI